MADFMTPVICVGVGMLIGLSIQITIQLDKIINLLEVLNVR